MEVQTEGNGQAVLVTGGAGYVGSHACKGLAEAGWVPVTYDDLSTGWRDAVRYGPFEAGSVLDRATLDAVFARHRPVAVMHFAAKTLVGEAVEKPGLYWRTNVCGTLTVAEAAVAAGVEAFVFSSTCAVYGEQDGLTLDEESALKPSGAYAVTKRAAEELLADFERAHGLRHVAFRYFNVAGADPAGEIGERHEPETHLIPLVLQTVAGERPELVLHGDDYDTPDGTAVRDYVHVTDLVRAHVAGLGRLVQGGESRVFNLGTGTGHSVREVVEAAGVITNRPVPHRVGPRRAGDAGRLVSGSERAEAELGWTPEHDLRTMIADAWRYYEGRR
jgi:UDP-glucose 4-epimerase